MTNEEYREFIQDRLAELDERSAQLRRVASDNLRAAADVERAANQLRDDLHKADKPEPARAPIPVRAAAPLTKVPLAPANPLGIRLAQALKAG